MYIFVVSLYLEYFNDLLIIILQKKYFSAK